jgi:hypothetical protein
VAGYRRADFETPAEIAWGWRDADLLEFLPRSHAHHAGMRVAFTFVSTMSAGLGRVETAGARGQPPGAR